jgi:hypothetical protein
MSTAIQEAVTAAFAAAEMAPPVVPGVVPLGALLLEHNLHHEEVPRLSRQRALGHLRRRTGADLPDLGGQADEELAGFLYVFPYQGEIWGCVLVNADHIIERRRFSAAHELGHYLLHFLPCLRRALLRGEHLFLAEGFAFDERGGPAEEAVPGTAEVVAQDALGGRLAAIERGTAELEAEANAFAAELLMPAEAVRRLHARHRGFASPRRLAGEFLVSPAAMRARLAALHLVS